MEEDEPAMKKITSGYRNRRENWVEWHQEGTLEKKKGNWSKVLCVLDRKKIKLSIRFTDMVPLWSNVFVEKILSGLKGA